MYTSGNSLNDNNYQIFGSDQVETTSHLGHEIGKLVPLTTYLISTASSNSLHRGTHFCLLQFLSLSELFQRFGENLNITFFWTLNRTNPRIQQTYVSFVYRQRRECDKIEYRGNGKNFEIFELVLHSFKADRSKKLHSLWY